MSAEKSDGRQDLFGLNSGQQAELAAQMRGLNFGGGQMDQRRRRDSAAIPAKFAQIAELPAYKQILLQRIASERMGIADPFFACHETKAKGRTRIDGKEFLNFSTYDYLGLNGHPEVNAAAAKAMEEFGTSAGASRLVSGERPPHALLEKGLADAFGVDGAVIFVSGHATNVSTLPTLLGPKDAVFYDALAHNSLIVGAALSGAARYAFAHNDPEALERSLREHRSHHERALIVTEGLFSMDGSIAKLPELLRLKKEYTCFLMLDEAHSLGALGDRGLGCPEHFGIPHHEVDIIMGTLSKTMVGCGGFIAGSSELVELLKYKAPGFVYSVGMPPPIAAASARALELMLAEPQRVARLRELSMFFLKEAKDRGLNTGYADGYAIVPIIVRNSLVAGLMSSALFKRRINVLPIIYPVVEESQARLRFFLSCEHTEEDILTALDAVREELANAQARVTESV